MCQITVYRLFCGCPINTVPDFCILARNYEACTHEWQHVYTEQVCALCEAMYPDREVDSNYERLPLRHFVEVFREELEELHNRERPEVNGGSERSGETEDPEQEEKTEDLEQEVKTEDPEKSEEAESEVEMVDIGEYVGALLEDVTAQWEI